jgi:uncharacterized protein
MAGCATVIRTRGRSVQGGGLRESDRGAKGISRVRKRLAVRITVMQSILFLGHGLLYETWTGLSGARFPGGNAGLAVTLGLLSLTFVTALLLAFRFSNPAVRIYYTIAAVWAGLLTYFVLAAGACWVIVLAARIGGFSFAPGRLVEAMFGLALAVGLYGVVNANWIRVRRITVPLANLPAQWQNRVAALVSDLHLGHVRNGRFARRVAAIIERLRPDIVFIAGDLYDGTAADVNRLARPLGRFRVPLGSHYIAGNHEEFHSHAKYLEAVRRAGIGVLDGEKVVLDGMQFVGVHYRDSVDADRFRTVLRAANLDAAQASLLLTHAPNHLEIAEEAGIGLELCGHTHAGQLFPFLWIPARRYGRYVYGLNRLGRLWVYTSSGVGTWGPPLRVGTAPEIVLIRFTSADGTQ